MKIHSLSDSNNILLLCTLCLWLPLSVSAWEYSSTGSTTEQVVQMRVGAEFTKEWKNGLQISLTEDLRFDLYDRIEGTTAKYVSADSTLGAAFNKSYTTISLGYKPIDYVKIDAGYTLRLLGRKGFSDANEFMRHRVFLDVSGIYRTRLVKLSLRERVLCDMRTDSVNTAEKNKYNCLLRSRISSEFIVPGKPVKPYVWVEVENTLNVPEYQQKSGKQFISAVRAQAGVKWRLTKMSSLNFYYRFQYGYDRDINITKKKEYIQLTQQTTFVHTIGVTYNFDW